MHMRMARDGARSACGCATVRPVSLSLVRRVRRVDRRCNVHRLMRLLLLQRDVHLLRIDRGDGLLLRRELGLRRLQRSHQLHLVLKTRTETNSRKAKREKQEERGENPRRSDDIDESTAIGPLSRETDTSTSSSSTPAWGLLAASTDQIADACVLFLARPTDLLRCGHVTLWHGVRVGHSGRHAHRRSSRSLVILRIGEALLHLLQLLLLPVVRVRRLPRRMMRLRVTDRCCCVGSLRDGGLRHSLKRNSLCWLSISPHRRLLVRRLLLLWCN
jgi:hypothetical protein